MNSKKLFSVRSMWRLCRESLREFKCHQLGYIAQLYCHWDGTISSLQNVQGMGQVSIQLFAVNRIRKCQQSLTFREHVSSADSAFLLVVKISLSDLDLGNSRHDISSFSSAAFDLNSQGCTRSIQHSRIHFLLIQFSIVICTIKWNNWICATINWVNSRLLFRENATNVLWIVSRFLVVLHKKDC